MATEQSQAYWELDNLLFLIGDDPAPEIEEIREKIRTRMNALSIRPEEN